MDNAKLVATTVSGTKINACAQLDFSRLVEFAKLAILDLSTTEKIVSVN